MWKRARRRQRQDANASRTGTSSRNDAPVERTSAGATLASESIGTRAPKTVSARARLHGRGDSARARRMGNDVIACFLRTSPGGWGTPYCFAFRDCATFAARDFDWTIVSLHIRWAASLPVEHGERNRVEALRRAFFPRRSSPHTRKAARNGTARRAACGGASRRIASRRHRRPATSTCQCVRACDGGCPRFTVAPECVHREKATVAQQSSSTARPQ
jgi:hypothetical protein